MLHSPVGFIGAAGAAFLLAGVTIGVLERPAFSSPQPLGFVGKSDRLEPRLPSGERRSVSSVELIGVSEATVILRSRDGTVLYRSDPLTNSTLVAKDADLPLVTVKETPESPIVENPAAPRRVNKPPSAEERKPTPVGCEGVVSALISRDIERVPGLCLVQAYTTELS